MISMAAANRVCPSYNFPAISGSVMSPVARTFLAINNPRMMRPSDPARSYQSAGNPDAKIRPPATMVADPPTVVAVIVAVSGNHPSFLSARKNPVDEVVFLEE